MHFVCFRAMINDKQLAKTISIMLRTALAKPTCVVKVFDGMFAGCAFKNDFMCDLNGPQQKIEKKTEKWVIVYETQNRNATTNYD